VAARARGPPADFPRFANSKTASSERIDMRAEFEGGLKGSADVRCLLPPIRTMAQDMARPIKRPGRFVAGLLVPIRRIDAVELSQQRRPREFTVPVG
jgi:hypothetical protein